MALRAYYAKSVSDFITESTDAVLGQITRRSEFEVTNEQRIAWLEQIDLLQRSLSNLGRGLIFFEFVVPRLGRRIDVVLLVDHVLFVIEFKVGPDEFTRAAREQVWDYALDLKNFHETSRHASIVPLLVATGVRDRAYAPKFKQYKDGVFYPEEITVDRVGDVIDHVLRSCPGTGIAQETWEAGCVFH